MEFVKGRENLNWHDFFMSIAILSSKKSKDPNTQVGSCIVKDKKIIGLGFNGLIKGWPDEQFNWSREGDPLNTKYFFIIHSEMNSILNVNNVSELKGASIYVSLFPCHNCALAICQVGIKDVYYLEDKYHDEDSSIAARKIFDTVGVKYIQYVPTIKQIIIDLEK